MQELVQEAEDEGTQEQRGQASANRNAHATSAPWRPASAGNVMARCSTPQAPLCFSCKLPQVLKATLWALGVQGNLYTSAMCGTCLLWRLAQPAARRPGAFARLQTKLPSAQAECGDLYEGMAQPEPERAAPHNGMPLLLSFLNLPALVLCNQFQHFATFVTLKRVHAPSRP